MITLYIANKNDSSWSLRPWLRLRQLRVQLKPVSFTAVDAFFAPLAFRAQTRQEVDDFHRLVLEAGGKDNGAPGLRPQYSAGYYAAFVIGPDGHNVEVVCHDAET